MSLFKEIENTIKTLDAETVDAERKKVLQPLIAFIQDKMDVNNTIRLNFICTHNSRRSHLSQLWAQTMASYHNVKHVYCYSGGTESTALNERVVKTLQKSGFQINKLSEENNPIYSIKFSENEHPVIGFSKTLDDEFNPKSEFAAIMTCSEADGGCPFVPGAEKRIPITYEDPKKYDNTPQESEKYEERNLQIATEMKYVFSQLKLN